MANMMESLYNIRTLEEFGEKQSVIHKIHPLIKVITTFVYLVTIISFSKYEISGLLPLVLYIVVLIVLSDIPVGAILKRTLVAAPIILGIGILNPLFDQQAMVSISGIMVSKGWISFLSLLIRGSLTVFAATILIATTGMERIAVALRMIRIPKVFVMQLLLTYRYISVLIEEVERTIRAYVLRSPRTKGIRFRDWGSLTGQLLIRTIERAQRVYQAMCCRGFTGEYHIGHVEKIAFGDIAYLLGWSLYFIIVRHFNISMFLGSLMTGVGK